MVFRGKMSYTVWGAIVVIIPCFNCSINGERPLWTEQRNGGQTKPILEKEDNTRLIFSFTFNRDVYIMSDWAESPQCAIWLEDTTHQTIRTVYVTHKTGVGDWEGKSDCPVALPYWVTRYNIETGTAGPPTYFEPAKKTVTGATPELTFQKSITVPRNSRWYYLIEVNVSGDYNEYFLRQSDEDGLDDFGNGQPSIVYEGYIQATDGTIDTPRIIGRTEQYVPVDTLTTDLVGIGSAAALFSEISVTCVSRSGEK